MRFAPDTIAVAVTGVVLMAAGVALAMWSRFVLGENWSAAVSIRKNHELIRMGPYRIMRHPIYTGMLLGLLGTALVGPRGRALRPRPSHRGARFLRQGPQGRSFPGAGFEAHAKHTGMFLPRV